MAEQGNQANLPWKASLTSGLKSYGDFHYKETSSCSSFISRADGGYLCRTLAKVFRHFDAILKMDDGVIIYRETPLPWPLRVFIAFIGICTGIGIPATWLANASLSMPLASHAVLGLVVAACAGFGVFCFIVAFASVNELVIDPEEACVTRTRRGPIVNDTTLIPRRDIGSPKVTLRDSDDGPFPILHMTLPGRKRFEMVNLENRTQAELWRDRIAAALSSPEA